VDQRPPAVVEPNQPLDVDLLSHAETPLDIGRPPADVFAYLSDFGRHVEWAHTYLRVEPPLPGPVEPGARLVVHEKQDLRWDKRPFTTIADRPGATYANRVEVTALDPHTHVAWRSLYDGGPLALVTGEWELRIEPITGRLTKLRFRAALLGPEPVLSAFGHRLLLEGHPLDVLARQVDRAMHNIRTILEGRA
jgi:hypothetical protein